MIKVVIFDWFGVCTEKWIDVWERELGNKVDKELLRKPFFKYLDQYADNTISGQQFLQSVLEEAGLESKGYEYLLRKHGKLNRELLSLISRLKSRYKTALLSDNFNEIVPAIEEDIGGFEKYFGVVILSNVLNVGKTNKRIYEVTLEHLGVESENCVFIDDKEKNLVIARKLGLKTILFESLNQLKIDLKKLGVEA